MRFRRCPCCAGTVPSGDLNAGGPGQKPWMDLCDGCAAYAFAFSACPHTLAAERRLLERGRLGATHR